MVTLQGRGQQVRKADAPCSQVRGCGVATVVLVWRVPVRAPHQVASVIREEGRLLSDPGGSSVGGGPEQEQSRPSCSLEGTFREQKAFL